MLTANTHDTTHKEILKAAKLRFQIAKGSLVINCSKPEWNFSCIVKVITTSKTGANTCIEWNRCNVFLLLLEQNIL